MGPRSCDRGKIGKRIATIEHMVELQWGRGHVTAESPKSEEASREWFSSLQWGRGHVTAESNSTHPGLESGTMLQWGRGHVTAERNRRDGKE